MTIRIRVLPRFPANITGANGLTVTREGTDLVVSPDMGTLVDNPTIDGTTTTFVMAYDSEQDSYTKISVQNLVNELQEVVIGTTLAAMAETAPTTDQAVYFTDTGVASVYALSAAGRALIDDADAAAQRTTLGLGTAATRADSYFASAAQGTLADTAVQPARAISAGTGLTGGGSLASDRTIGLDTASIASLALADSALQPADRPKVGIAVGPSNGVDDTAAIQAALDLAESSGIGRAWVEGEEYLVSQISIPRFVVLEGMGIGPSCLTQLGGSNQDFILSENFASLEGSGLTVADSELVPSFYGLRNIRVNGNKANQTAGRGVCFYGPAQVMDNVLIYDCFGDGLHTEYSASFGSSSWQGQEEGQFGLVICRDNGGNGWTYRGPHNSFIKCYLGGYNGEWGFKSDASANWDGNIDYVSHIHTYANGRNYTPHGDMGQSYGAIARIGSCITDGDNLRLDASKIIIGIWRAANCGGELDGLVVTGNDCRIGMVNAEMWISSTGKKAIDVVGDRFNIGQGSLVINNADNDGLVVSGNDCDINMFIQGASASGRKGITYTGTRGRIQGTVVGCDTAFHYTRGANNKVDLEITTSTGQLAVGGDAPAQSDTFDIHAAGTGQVGRTRNWGGTSSGAANRLALDTTSPQTKVIAHGLLYAPTDVHAYLRPVTNVTDFRGFTYEFISADATNVTLRCYLTTASATVGAVADIRIQAFNDGT